MGIFCYLDGLGHVDVELARARVAGWAQGCWMGPGMLDKVRDAGCHKVCIHRTVVQVKTKRGKTFL